MAISGMGRREGLVSPALCPSEKTVTHLEWAQDSEQCRKVTPPLTSFLFDLWQDLLTWAVAEPTVYRHLGLHSGSKGGKLISSLLSWRRGRWLGQGLVLLNMGSGNKPCFSWIGSSRIAGHCGDMEGGVSIKALVKLSGETEA